MAGKNNNIIRRVEGIDEKELLESLAEMSSKEVKETPENREVQPKIVSGQPEEEDMEEEHKASDDEQEEEPANTPGNRKGEKTGGYRSLYLQPRELKNRQCVYISQEIHETILAIVSRIAVKSMTVGAFIDTVLRKHLEENKEEINNLYRRKRDDLIK